MTETERLIQKCIEIDAARINSPLVVALEREGDAAFDRLRSRLLGQGPALRARHVPAALRLLAAISKHQGRLRRAECLKVVLPFVCHPSAAVRTTAAHLIVWSGTGDHSGKLGTERPPIGELQKAVAQALVLGVEAKHRAVLERFVSHSKKDGFVRNRDIEGAADLWVPHRPLYSTRVGLNWLTTVLVEHPRDPERNYYWVSIFRDGQGDIWGQSFRSLEAAKERFDSVRADLERGVLPERQGMEDD